MRCLVFAMISFSFSFVTAAPVLRSSSMNHDLVINDVLYHALEAGFGTIPQIRRTQAGSTNSEWIFSLVSHGDILNCSRAKCDLTWDTVSKNYPADSGTFQSALFDTLEKWATYSSDGLTSPSLHRSIYKQTGSIQLLLSSEAGNTDRIMCTFFNPQAPVSWKECTLQVSDVVSGQDKALEEIYESLLHKKSLIDVVKDSVLSSVSTALFLAPTDRHYGNRTFTVVHTLSTNLLIDRLVASRRYGYKTPMKNSSGQVISHGIELTLNGSRFANGNLAVEEVTARSYALAHQEPFR